LILSLLSLGVLLVYLWQSRPGVFYVLLIIYAVVVLAEILFSQRRWLFADRGQS